jgi:5-methylcytosine-specific restriction endonuclease McrA
MNNTCRICNKEYEYTKELRRKGYRKTLCNTCSCNQSRRKSKKRAIDYKGGKCQVCGYNKSIEALCFHHINPDEKSFGIGSKGSSIAWKKLKNEIDKCILLCQNCHCEIHANITILS